MRESLVEKTDLSWSQWERVLGGSGDCLKLKPNQGGTFLWPGSDTLLQAGPRGREARRGEGRELDCREQEYGGAVCQPLGCGLH